MSSIPQHTHIQVSKDIEFTDLVYDETTVEELTYRTSHTFDVADLPWIYPKLYMRVRHFHGGVQLYTPWSDVVDISINTPPSIVGICLDPTSKSLRTIDGMGNLHPTFDYTTHPSYSGITMVSSGEADGAMTLTKIPMCYVHTATSGPIGSYSEGKKCWWISDLRATDFKPHPAFKRSEGDIAMNSAYLGTYLCSELEQNGTIKAVSRKNMEVLTRITKAEADDHATNLGSAYRVFDIWDLSLVKLLAIIAKSSGNVQEAWGRNDDEFEPRTGSTPCGIIFKGTASDPLVLLADLWQNYWYYVDRIRFVSGTYTLYAPSNDTETIFIDKTTSVGYAVPPETSGWIVDVADAIIHIGGDEHNLQELMLPSVVSVERTDSPFDDYFSASSGSNNFIAGCSKTYSTIESVGYWATYGSACPRREEVAIPNHYIRCIQSDNPCDETMCRYYIDTAVNANWSDKAGLFSVCMNSLPSSFIGMRVSKS